MEKSKRLAVAMAPLVMCDGRPPDPEQDKVGRHWQSRTCPSPANDATSKIYSKFSVVLLDPRVECFQRSFTFLLFRTIKSLAQGLSLPAGLAVAS